jgi:hypothetical protein
MEASDRRFVARRGGRCEPLTEQRVGIGFALRFLSFVHACPLGRVGVGGPRFEMRCHDEVAEGVGADVEDHVAASA